MEKFKSAYRRVLDFREKIRNLSRLQKLIILVLVVAVPAGIALASALLVAWSRKRKE